MTTDGIVRSCGACGARNRTPINHLTDTGRCGSCKAPLPPMSEPIDVDSSLFDQIIKTAAVPVLVDFWAEWCGPCRMAAPHVKKLAAEVAGKALVLKVDTDAHQDLAARYEVRSIPNFVVLKNGQVVSQQAGLAPTAQMKQWIDEAAGAVA